MKVISALLGSLLVCVGCATQPGFKPMPEAAAGKSKSVQTVVSVGQKEINADIVVSNTAAAMSAAGIFGLLPALAAATVDAAVNNSRAKDAEAAVTPVRNSIVDLNLNEVLRDSLEKSLKSVTWMGGAPVTLNTDLKKEVHEKLYADSTHDGVLMVTYEYRLSADFSTLNVSANANLYPKSADLRTVQTSLYPTSKLNEANAEKMQMLNSLYTHSISFSAPLGSKPADITAGGKLWAENNGQRVRAALNESIGVIAHLISSDLGKPVPLTASAAEKLVKKEPYTIALNNKRYRVTQQPWGASSVVPE